MCCIAVGWKKIFPSSASLFVSFLAEKDIGRVLLQQLVGILSHIWHFVLHYMTSVKYINTEVDQMQLRKPDFGLSGSFGEPLTDSEQAKVEPLCLS